MIEFLTNFGLLFIIVVIISFIAKLLKQPIIIGYVLSGFMFAFVLSNESLSNEMTIFSEVGITFLLFLMGLEFDFKSIRFLGKDILITTLLQSTIFFAFGFSVSRFFGQDIIPSIYLALLFMFSSTLLAAKWLEDKKESKALHGKIVLGTLILQDLIAILALTVIALLKQQSMASLVLVPFKGILLFLIAFILSRFVLGRLLKFASRYPELLFIFSLSICFFFVLISPLLGYTTTIGAFIAGVVLANTIYKLDISIRMKPLVIFFTMLFFVSLGFQLNFNVDTNLLYIALTLCLAGLILKPIIIFLTLKMRGYDNKSSFLSGIYLSQISEFGIIIVASGVVQGDIGKNIEIIGVIVLLSSLILSSYLINYSQGLYNLFTPVFRYTDKVLRFRKQYDDEISDANYTILFFGYYDLNSDILEKFKSLHKKTVVVENDPEKIEILKSEGYNYIYNSVNNPEFFEHIPFKQIELVVSNLTDINDNKLILKELKSKNPGAVAIMAAKSLKDSIDLYDNGADYVLFTSYLNNQQVSVLLEDYATDINKIVTKKIVEQTKLRNFAKKRKDANKRLVISIEELTGTYINGMRNIKDQVGNLVRKSKKTGKSTPKP